ncbi:hypothetical protein [Cohnella sp. GCM10027633]|uniref:5' nucleotidase, NT5C type n=1 Tax=unclassified Cohnella TaxID=2636738 RepID=UPI00362F983C
MKNIKIVVDLDNTLLDATTPHLKYYNLASGLNFTKEDVIEFYIYRLYNWNKEERDRIYYEHGYNIHWESVPYLMSIETLNQLFMQHHITIMTARPSHYRDVTVKWLEYYGAKYHDLVFTESKYSEFRNIEADVLVDDAPHYAMEFSQVGTPVILFNQPYNDQIDNEYIYRATSWKAVEEHIINLNKIVNKYMSK